MIVPFFIRTSVGPVLSTARLPDGGRLDDAVLTLGPRGRHNRTRIIASITEALVGRGRPVFSIQYPDSGSARDLKNDKGSSRDAIAEALAGLSAVTDIRSWSVVGLCHGGLIALNLATRDLGVHTVVGPAFPFLRRTPPPVPIRRGRRARLERLFRRDRTPTPADGPFLMPDALSNLETAARHCQIHLVYGSDDGRAEHFHRAVAMGGISKETLALIHVQELEGPLVERNEDVSWLDNIAISAPRQPAIDV